MKTLKKLIINEPFYSRKLNKKSCYIYRHRLKTTYCAECTNLSDRVDVAVCQQLLLQRTQELVEVSGLIAVRRWCSLLQLIAVLLQLAKGLILNNTNTSNTINCSFQWYHRRVRPICFPKRWKPVRVLRKTNGEEKSQSSEINIKIF